MSKVMITIESQDAAPTIEQLQGRYNLLPADIDSEFGVVEIDPEQHLYTILVDEGAARKITTDERWKVQGPFSNPHIEPFGPPE
jgi:hypothetical protein